jgi:nitrite reductase/ring-hydroxylating ferredoxin subunit
MLGISLFKRIFGLCETAKPEDEGCWKYSNGKVVIDWARAPELRKPCGAIRVEKMGFEEKLLVIYGLDGQFHALRNSCPHHRRRLDPVDRTLEIQCCSLSKSTFDYAGNVISGPSEESLKKYKVKTRKCKIIIWID